MLRNSPTALRVLKSALNAAEDGQAGIQVGHATAAARTSLTQTLFGVM
jgi:1,4-dihydroxy-2-naphthoyl-CoA synthase